MSNKGVKIILPSAVTDTNMRKLEHYYGIEFTRGASNGGGDNGYHAMIGDATLLKEMRFHNQMKIVNVQNASIAATLNQTNWNKNDDGSVSTLDGSDNGDIMQVHTHTVYAILGGTNPTYERFIISDQPFSYDGDQAKAYDAYGECPDYATMLNSALRSIRNEGVNGSQAAGICTNHSDSQYGAANGAGYPRTSLSRFAFEQYSRAKNEEVNSNLPYTIICNQDIELTQAFMFIEFRTKQLNSILGHGISAVAVPTEQTWGKVTGIRMTSDGGATYTYGGFNKALFINGATTSQNMWTAFNGSCPLLKMFEAQLAISNGDTLEALNDADGNPVQTLADGVMTGIWTKRFSFQVTAALTAGGEQKVWTVEAVLRVPVWRGRTRLWGHLSQCYAGYELLNFYDGTNTIHKVFRAPSVEALISDTDVATKTEEGMFLFEQKYEYIGDLAKIGTVDSGAWGTDVLDVDGVATPLVSAGGGSLVTHESAYFYARAQTQVGVYSRRGPHFGGYSNGGLAALRFAFVNVEPSSASTGIGSGFRVQLNG